MCHTSKDRLYGLGYSWKQGTSVTSKLPLNGRSTRNLLFPKRQGLLSVFVGHALNQYLDIELSDFIHVTQIVFLFAHCLPNGVTSLSRIEILKFRKTYFGMRVPFCQNPNILFAISFFSFGASVLGTKFLWDVASLKEWEILGVYHRV